VHLVRPTLAQALILLLLALDARAELPPVPVPAENPITEAKRVLGKILFWDEQLSSDDSIACGTCHRPGAGGIDPRAGRHPGVDAGSIDDVRGSPGIHFLDHGGRRQPHPVFGDRPQITPRLSQPISGALWATELFWDGRAGSEFRDPLTNERVIANGGALENQVLAALASDAEMARPERPWQELIGKLESVKPLAFADRWPRDIETAIESNPDYPALFSAAFGDPHISPVRLALAIASYERTLVPDQTAWDRFQAGDENALSDAELIGWQALQSFHCTNCHTPPLFTNNDFANIGLRRTEFDRGREQVTGDPEDAGEFKVPSLRNVGLRPRFMHTGEFAGLGAAIGFYRNGPALPDRDDIPGIGIYAFNMGPLNEADMLAFLSDALTDPRMREERFPFDRPRLRSERNIDEP
jgi:cytochrome c peroxidase